MLVLPLALLAPQGAPTELLSTDVPLANGDLIDTIYEVDVADDGTWSARVRGDSSDQYLIVDGSIVLRGRTVLKKKQLLESLLPLLGFMNVSRGEAALRIHDGSFELRVAGRVAEAAKPTLDSAKAALWIFSAAALFGFLGMKFVWAPIAAIVWSAGLIGGGLVLRSGLVNGRSRMGARLAMGLGMLAQEEGLVLPPDEAALDRLAEASVDGSK